MSQGSIVAGVDASEEGVRAAVLAWRIAQSAGLDCHLVHAVRDVLTDVAALTLPGDVTAINRVLVDDARASVVNALKGWLPDTLLQHLDVRTGKVPLVLAQVASDHGAEAVVLGGKRHSAIERWLAGSTDRDVLRTSEIPVLVAGPVPTLPHRILVAVDFSFAAAPTLAVAQRFAKMLKAELQVLHVVPPTPVMPHGAPDLFSDAETLLHRSEEQFAERIWPLVTYPGTRRRLAQGTVPDLLRREAREWHADLVVVGSHGRGWVDRLLLGSTTRRLLEDLPASLLVIPVKGPPPRSDGERGAEKR